MDAREVGKRTTKPSKKQDLQKKTPKTMIKKCGVLGAQDAFCKS